MKLLYKYFLLCALCFSAVYPKNAVAALSWDAAPITVETPGLQVRLQPRNGWTIDRIDYKNQQLTAAGGFYSLTMDLASGKFVGTGHTEGGKEEVISVEIEQDGKKIDITPGSTLTGSDFKITKTSKIATTSLRSVLHLTADRLDAEQFLHVDKNLDVTKIYAFMFPWSLETTEWIAENIGGKALEGQFKPFVENSKESRWELTDNVRWNAIYNPVQKVAVLTTFAPDSQSGEGIKHGYWNQKAYHKQYYQAIGVRQLQTGEDFHWVSTLRPIEIKTDEWKTEVRAVAATLEAPIPSKDKRTQ